MITQNAPVFYAAAPIFIAVVTLAAVCYHRTVVTSPGAPPGDLVLPALPQNDLYDNRVAIRQQAQLTQELRRKLHLAEHDSPMEMYQPSNEATKSSC